MFHWCNEFNYYKSLGPENVAEKALWLLNISRTPTLNSLCPTIQNTCNAIFGTDGLLMTNKYKEDLVPTDLIITAAGGCHRRCKRTSTILFHQVIQLLNLLQCKSFHPHTRLIRGVLISAILYNLVRSAFLLLIPISNIHLKIMAFSNNRLVCKGVNIKCTYWIRHRAGAH